MRPDDPSDTATIIARSILLSSRDPRLSVLVAPGEADAARRMLGGRATRGWFGFALRNAGCRNLLMAAERRLLGGIFAHYLARKRWIERQLRRFLEAGGRQVVVAGAGYDALTWRLHGEFPDVRFFEIDHPATQAAKRTALGSRINLHFIAADLSERLPSEALASCGEFSPATPAIVIAEGLTMYFDEARVAALLRSLASAAGPGGQVLFSYMEPGEDGSICFRGEHPAVGWWLRLRREPFRWGCLRSNLPEFVEDCGLRVLAVADHDTLKHEILTPRGSGGIALARGEVLCLCETTDS